MLNEPKVTKQSKTLSYEEEETIKMRRARPQFDFMKGLSVLGITLANFREVSSRNNKDEVSLVYIFILFYFYKLVYKNPQKVQRKVTS